MVPPHGIGSGKLEVIYPRGPITIYELRLKAVKAN